jgi:hypothetical protein
MVATAAGAAVVAALAAVVPPTVMAGELVAAAITKVEAT